MASLRPTWSTLAEACAGSVNVLLAAPYIKLPTLAMIIDMIAPDAKLVCVTRWNPYDIAVGASDLECRTAVVARNGLFLIHPNLHAKYYRFDERILVGSANITGAGLGHIPASNLEILCSPSDEFSSSEFEEELLKESREIGDAEFENWMSIQAINMPAEWPKFSEEPNSLVAWRPHARDPEHLWLAYTDRTSEIASYDERVLVARDTRDMGIPINLPREAFNAWVGGCLLSSAFVSAATGLRDAGPSAEWAEFADSWGMSRADAIRAIETAQAWRAAFLA